MRTQEFHLFRRPSPAFVVTAFLASVSAPLGSRAARRLDILALRHVRGNRIRPSPRSRPLKIKFKRWKIRRRS